MKVIRKKILPTYFDAVESRQKNFEIRKDDDDVQVGDKLILREWNEEQQYYTGRFVTRKAKYVLRNAPEYGLNEGYCIVSW
mgnify:CR=1 FL=1